MEKSITKKPIILVINPGSTSTKIAIFKGKECLFEQNIHHAYDKLKTFKCIMDQYKFRRDTIIDSLQHRGFSLDMINVVAARGGFLRPIPGGTYHITKKMVDELKSRAIADHAANLGIPLAFYFMKKHRIPGFTTDPVVVDELSPVARISGYEGIERKSYCHCLSIKETVRKVCKRLGVKYSKVNLIIAHLGGGISISAHWKGKMVDVNNAFLGEGPFSPQRAGTLPLSALIDMCYHSNLTEEEVKSKLSKSGGLISYLGTDDAITIEKEIMKGDRKAKLVYQAMAYQISKYIAAMAAALNGKVTSISITGDLARSKLLTVWIKKRISFIAPVLIFPGEDEMKALAEGALRVLSGEEKPRIY